MIVVVWFVVVEFHLFCVVDCISAVVCFVGCCFVCGVLCFRC